MSDYTDLQKAAKYAAQDTIKFADEDEEMRALQQFHEEVDPETILALIAENERLRENPHMRAIRSLRGDCADLAAERDRLQSAANTLVRIGYTDHGGELWKPPIGQKPNFDKIDQLRAEVAGLKTGYEAYERVNAELKAEVEALRKDSESYRLLSFCHGQGTLELVRSHHELCAEIRRLKILSGEPVPPTPEEFVGPSPEGPTARIRRKLAALGQGEQS